MKKFSLSVFCVFVLVLFPFQDGEAFSDVKVGGEGFLEIDFLSDAGLIRGNVLQGEEVFLGDNFITRCEFLKILISTQYRSLEYARKDPRFSDLSSEHWCYELADFALSYDIAQGNRDTFSPDKPVTRAEAVKMMFGYFDFDLGKPTEQLFFDVLPGDWVFPYASFASWYGIDGSDDTFLPYEFLTRKDAAVLLYRSLWVLSFQAPYDDSYRLNQGIFDVFKEKKVTISSEIISKNAFDDVLLDIDIPAIFREGAFHIISGRVRTGEASPEVSVFLYNIHTQQVKRFEAKVTGGNFEALVVFPQKGKYLIDILSGARESSQPQEIVVREESSDDFLFENQPFSCSVDFRKIDEGDLEIALDSSYEYQIEVQSQSFQKYFYTHDIKSFIFPYAELWGWPEGDMIFRFSGVKKSRGESENCYFQKSIHAVEHQLTEYDRLKISVSNLSHFAEVGEGFTWNGKSSEVLRPDMAIITSDGSVEEIPLTHLDVVQLEPSTRFNVNYVFKESGVYRMEINHVNGIAQLNYPIYVGDVYPLLPDFDTVIKSYVTKPMYGSLDDMRQQVLEWINKERKKQKVKEVILDPVLNSFAQAHTDDMDSRNYFGHNGPLGETLSERYEELGITTAIGENLGSGYGLKHAYTGLLYSAIHRDNLLNPQWNTVGIGITVGEDNIVKLAQEFSYKMYTPANESEIELATLNFINKYRRENGFLPLRVMSGPKEYLDDWSDQMLRTDNVNVVQGNVSFIEELQSGNFESILTGIVLRVNNLISLEQEIESFSESLLRKNVHFVSLASAIDEMGNVYITLALFE